MLLNKLGFVISNLCEIKRSTCLLLQKGIKNKSMIDEAFNDTPIPYSKTEAAKWKASYNRCAPNEQVWYTPFVVSGSIMVFLIYFCILREENDIDELIYRPLPETIKGIDKTYSSIDFNQKPDFVRYHEEKKIVVK